MGTWLAQKPTCYARVHVPLEAVVAIGVLVAYGKKGQGSAVREIQKCKEKKNRKTGITVHGPQQIGRNVLVARPHCLTAIEPGSHRATNGQLNLTSHNGHSRDAVQLIS